MPQISVESVKLVVEFRIEDNMLMARTLLPPTDGQVRLIVPQMRGVVRIFVRHRSETDLSASEDTFQLLQHVSDDQDSGEVYTMVSVVPNRLILSRDSESDRQVCSVQLIEDFSEGTVRLLVDRLSKLEGERSSHRIDLRAEDFVRLCRTHWREVDEYLRPILRDYQQEAKVFAVPAEMAWQVLEADALPDPQVAARVEKIVSELDSEDFRQREKAVLELRELRHSAVAALRQLDRSRFSPQQNSGIDSLLAELAPLSPSQVKQLAGSVSFLLDVLYNDDPVLRGLALDRLSRLTGRRVELDGNLDPAARADAIAKLRDDLLSPTEDQR